jgi:hypothetical protein
MTATCASLHQLASALPRWSFPFASESIPQNGIYLLFEQGEIGHGAQRIVRIGTHTGGNQLRSRLKQHFLNPNKDRSIFRKNIGRALLNRDGDPFLSDWNLDLTTRKMRDLHGSRLDRSKQEAVEKRVSDYIQERFQFAVVSVPDKTDRLAWESRIVSTVSLCDECRASVGWLGNHSPVPKIVSSGLWQVHELYKAPFSELEFEAFRLATTHAQFQLKQTQ